ncbi:hypothetical protein [Zwartia sp.]|uniref:hypothetical protein n=1 Tax=Zwartia sp. TaxID=2978004 RepID=UPI0027204444|nr:hypothetical protein [Zwartia sp.]MDO9025919.1 hypothetical protein [Zwartia sp.]
MKKIKTFTLLILLSCQLAFASVAMSFSSSQNAIHQLYSHDLNIDHHHHDAFSMHLEESNGEAKHQHATDASLTADLAPLASTMIAKPEKQRIAIGNQLVPPDIFLEGPLRPPRTHL